MNEIENYDDDGSEFYEDLKQDYLNAYRKQDEALLFEAYSEAMCMGVSQETILGWRGEVHKEIADYLFCVEQPCLFEDNKDFFGLDVADSLIDEVREYLT